MGYEGEMMGIVDHERMILRMPHHDQEMAEYVNSVTRLVLAVAQTTKTLEAQDEAIIYRIDQLVAERNEWRAKNLPALVIDMIRNYVNGRFFGKAEGKASLAAIHSRHASPLTRERLDQLPAIKEVRIVFDNYNEATIDVRLRDSLGDSSSVVPRRIAQLFIDHRNALRLVRDSISDHLTKNHATGDEDLDIALEAIDKLLGDQ